jgi:hypothetical protein
LDFLPSEKVQECLAMEERFRVLREQFTSARPPLAAKDLQAGFQSLQTRQDSEFEAMLSVGELAEHKLRGSRFAYGRFEVGLAFTEEEMRGIVRIQEKFGATPTGTSSANSPGAQMPEGQKQQREELQQLLGAERVAQYDRVQDNRYQEFYRVADRFQLPAGVAAEGYEIRMAAEALAGQVRLDATISEEQRSAQLSAIRAETERSLADAYGPPAFKIYQTRSGQWLARLDGARANDR